MSAETDAGGLRVAKAFLIGPSSGSIVLAAWYAPTMGRDWLIGVIAMAPFVAVVAYSITLVVGLPAYLLLRRRFRPRIFFAAMAGGLVATAPFALVGIIGVLDRPTPRLNWGGLIEFVDFVGPISASGVVTGFAFWLIGVWRDPDPDRYLKSHGAKSSCDSISS